MLKELSESWKYGLIIEDDIMSDNYGCIIKIIEFEKEKEL